jgi:hypothetical protein
MFNVRIYRDFKTCSHKFNFIPEGRAAKNHEGRKSSVEIKRWGTKLLFPSIQIFIKLKWRKVKTTHGLGTFIFNIKWHFYENLGVNNKRRKIVFHFLQVSDMP